jgi:hypothetical protein
VHSVPPAPHLEGQLAPGEIATKPHRHFPVGVEVVVVVLEVVVLEVVVEDGGQGLGEQLPNPWGIPP